MKKSKKISFEGREPVFIFRNPIVKCTLEKGVYGEEDAAKVHEMLLTLTQKIMIDKSYVKYKGTKYKDTFLTEEGWTDLSEAGKYIAENNNRVSKYVKQNMDQAYRLMIEEYLGQILGLYGYEIGTFELRVLDKDYITAEIVPDIGEEWKYYEGDWRDR